MQVNLRRDFFGPNNVLYLERDNPHDFPTSWEDKLPPGAEIVGKGPVVHPGKADDPKVDGLTAGNKPQDAPAVVDGTEEDNSQLTDAEADKIKAQLEKAAQAGQGATGGRPQAQPQDEARNAAKEGSTPAKK